MITNSMVACSFSIAPRLMGILAWIMTVQLIAIEAPPAVQQPTFRDATYEVRQFGALGDGKTNDTLAINAAIARCNAEGGGAVVFTTGTYVAASIRLRSHVKLVIHPDAVIRGAASGYDLPEPNPNSAYQDFGHSHFRNALLWGVDLEDVAITGGGRIDGGRLALFDPKQADLGDKVLALASCRRVMITDITHKSGGHFVYLLNDCENVTLRKVTILNSRDGVDLMGCRHVRISECTFTGCIDDTIGIKSDWALGRKIASRDIHVWDCTLDSGCNALQFGSETAGDFSDIHFRDIRITRAMKAGIGITSNDGGIIDGVTYRNITMTGVAVPIYMLVTSRLRSGDPARSIGTIRNIHIADVVATDCRPGIHGTVQPITISGRPNAQLAGITLERVTVTFPGGGAAALADITPPYPKEYAPKYFGERPAAGLFIRQVRGLVLRDVSVAFTEPDLRPAAHLADIDGATITNFRAPSLAGFEPIRLLRVQDVEISGSPGVEDRLRPSRHGITP